MLSRESNNDTRPEDPNQAQQPAELRSPRILDRHQRVVVDQQAAANSAPAPLAPPAPVPLEHHTEQVVQSPSGIERHERTVTSAAGVEHREQRVTDFAAERRQRNRLVTQVVWMAGAFVVVLIGLRVILKLIGANPEAAFASVIYDFAGVFLVPFFGLTSMPSSGSMVLEIPSLIAMGVYAGLTWIVIRVIRMFTSQTTTRSSSIYDHHRV